ncbi:hypothetical protein CsSME_00041740 [Camellia sinensis var. sinensis]
MAVVMAVVTGWFEYCLEGPLMKASLRSFLVSELEFSIKASSNFKSQLVSSSIRLRLTFVLKKLGGARGFAAANAQGLKIKGVEDIIAVASGKGGVGKCIRLLYLALLQKKQALPVCRSCENILIGDGGSKFYDCEFTECASAEKLQMFLFILVEFAVNLAVALANKCRLKVGLLDADVYGPSIPTMMKLHGKPEVSEDKKMIPIENHGVKCMSMGFLLAEKYAPIVWRGPMVMKALEQMSRGVEWGNLDILVVDMPPGTGDAQISISQRLQLSGALIVSTPQDVALMDARRGVNMFSKVEVPILGLLENMSFFKCPHCGEPSHIFGKGGARKTADEMGLQFLGEIPLEVEIRSCSDEGVPVVISNPDSTVSKAYGDVALKVVSRLEELSKQQQLRPEINL